MRIPRFVYGFLSLLSVFSPEGGSNALAQATPEPDAGTVRVRLFGADGRLGAPVEARRVVLPDAEWRRRRPPPRAARRPCSRADASGAWRPSSARSTASSRP